MDDLEEQVRDLIDKREVSVIDSDEEDDGNYWSFRIMTADDVSLKVYSKFPGGPIVITSKIRMRPGLIHLFSTGEEEERIYANEQKRQFQNLLISILTNASGRFLFLDYNDETCGFDEMEKIQLKHRIYRDGLSQHALMNGIIDQTSALEFISEIMSEHKSNLTDNS